jgi:anaerobic dimethyl sulfoxide reductase subunit C (anchor subunit)
VSEIAAMRRLALLAFPVVAAGMLVSVLHLGRPRSAWKSLVNLGQSRLSLEVVLSALFAASAFVYGSFWFLQTTQMRLALGMMTATLGLAAVISSAMIYTVVAQPVWHSGWVPASFVGTTLLLGGIGPGVVMFRTGNNPVALVFLAVTAAGAVALLCSAVWMLVRFERVRKEQIASERLDEPAPSLSPRQYVYFALYILLAGLVPSALSLGIWIGVVTSSVFFRTAPLTLALFLSSVAGVVLGRKLMYDLALSRPRPWMSANQYAVECKPSRATYVCHKGKTQSYLSR